jgi:hypothetical protein
MTARTAGAIRAGCSRRVMYWRRAINFEAMIEGGLIG